MIMVMANCIVLNKVVRVLESAYGYDKGAIITVLEWLLSTHALQGGAT